MLKMLRIIQTSLLASYMRKTACSVLKVNIGVRADMHEIH